MVHKDTSTLVLVSEAFLSECVQKTSWCAGDEVIDRNQLSGKQVVSLQGVSFFLDRRLDRSGHWLATLFGKLTGRAQRTMSQLGCG